jgi:hypothetical protein
VTFSFQIHKLQKKIKTGWVYPQMTGAIKEKVKDSIILVFSSRRLSNLMNYG